MLDLEQQLRDEIRGEADAFEPSPDFERRISRRIDRHTRDARLLAAAAVALGVMAVATVGLAAAGQDERESIDTIDDPTPDPQPERDATTVPTTTPTTTEDMTSTSTSTTLDEADLNLGPEVGDSTPLNRRGVGPIVAGMTIFEAELAGDFGISVDPEAWDGFGRVCAVFHSEVSDHLYVAMIPGMVPSDDPKEAVIVAIGGDYSPVFRTEEGIAVGATPEEVRAVYGEPTSFDPDPSAVEEDEGVLVYEEDGYAYGFRVIDGEVVGIRSGVDIGYGSFEPCQ